MDANPYAAPQAPRESADRPCRRRITIVEVMVWICVAAVLMALFAPAVQHRGRRRSPPPPPPLPTVEAAEPDVAL